MPRSEVDGRPASLDAAIAEAAAVLGGARLPVIGGLGGDVAAARAGVLLAEKLGGVLDHMDSDAMLGAIDVQQRSGWMTISPGEVARSCDLLFQVGSGAPDLKAKPDAARLFAEPADLPILRALVAGVAPAQLGSAADRLLPAALALKQAKFGVAVWASGQLPAPSIEVLMGLVGDLNAINRFSTVPPAGSDNGTGVLLASTWMTGFPPRTGFGRGMPGYDPWTYDAARLMASGEADAGLWLSSYRPVAPAWRGAQPIVAIVHRQTKFKRVPRVRIDAGVPGIDHDTIAFDAERGALGAVAASRASDAWPAARIVDAIREALA